MCTLHVGLCNLWFPDSANVYYHCHMHYFGMLINDVMSHDYAIVTCIILELSYIKILSVCVCV